MEGCCQFAFSGETVTGCVNLVQGLVSLQHKWRNLTNTTMLCVLADVVVSIDTEMS